MPEEKIKQIIGWTVMVDLPRLRLNRIIAKIDTGANYCTLHCHRIEIKEKKGEKILCFNLLDPTHPGYKDKTFRFPDFIEKSIKNSFGDSENRFLIKTSIRIEGRRINTWISLTHRGNMKYPMLLGRKILRNKFIVDVSTKLKHVT
jgi:hypothetical protein